MSTLLLTGLPRSGTTLLCALLNTVPNTVALAEPLSKPRHRDPASVVADIEGFIAQVRERALTTGMIPSKVKNGKIADNFMEPPRTDGELRRSVAVRQDIAVGKRLKPDFRLYLKQPAQFTALIDELQERWPVYALIRSPLAVLASWQTIDFNVRNGRAPAAEILDSDLRQRLDGIEDRIDRQVELMAWFLTQYARLPERRVLTYEDLVANPTALLWGMHPKLRLGKAHIRPEPSERRYEGVDIAGLAERLTRILPVIERFYPDYGETLQAAMAHRPAPAVQSVRRTPLVDFFLGVQKGGTTALDKDLREHPEVQMANTKEPHFFDDESKPWSKPDYTSYDVWFHPLKTGARVRGDATPIYLFWPNSLERIARYNPAARFIVCLRHPAYRAHSQWRMQIAKGTESLPFSEVIRPIGRRRLQEPSEAAQRNYSYIERGLYAEQVQRLLSLFPKSQCLFLRTDQMWNDRECCMARIADFLGIAPFPAASRTSEYVVPYETTDLGHPDPADLAYMMTLFREDIERTAGLTGLDLTDWVDPGYTEPMAAPVALTA